MHRKYTYICLPGGVKIATRHIMHRKKCPTIRTPCFWKIWKNDGDMQYVNTGETITVGIPGKKPPSSSLSLMVALKYSAGIFGDAMHFAKHSPIIVPRDIVKP